MSANDNFPEVLNAEQCAAFLGIAQNTVYEWAGRGSIPHRKVGRRLLFSKQALLHWLADRPGAEVGA